MLLRCVIVFIIALVAFGPLGNAEYISQESNLHGLVPEGDLPRASDIDLSEIESTIEIYIEDGEVKISPPIVDNFEENENKEGFIAVHTEGTEGETSNSQESNVVENMPTTEEILLELEGFVHDIVETESNVVIVESDSFPSEFSAESHESNVIDTSNLLETIETAHEHVEIDETPSRIVLSSFSVDDNIHHCAEQNELIDSLVTEKDNLNHELQNLRSTIVDMQQSCSANKSLEFAELQLQVTKCSQEIPILQSECAKDIETLRSNLTAECASKVSTCETQLSIVTEQCEKRDNEHSAVIVDQRQQIENLRNQVDSMESNQVNFASDAKTALESCQAREVEIQTSLETCNKNTAAAEELSSARGQELAYVKSLLEYSRQEVVMAKRNASVYEVKAKLSKNEESLAKIGAENCQLQAEVSKNAYEEQIATLRSEVMSLRRQLEMHKISPVFQNEKVHEEIKTTGSSSMSSASTHGSATSASLTSTSASMTQQSQSISQTSTSTPSQSQPSIATASQSTSSIPNPENQNKPSLPSTSPSTTPSSTTSTTTSSSASPSTSTSTNTNKASSTFISSLVSLFTSAFLGLWSVVRSLWVHHLHDHYLLHVDPWLRSTWNGVKGYYYEHLEDLVIDFVEPIWDFVWRKGNLCAYYFINYYDDKDMYYRWMYQTYMFFADFGYALISMESWVSLIGRLSSPSGVVFPLVAIAVALYALFALRKYIFGVFSAVLLAVMSPLLLVAYLLKKLLKWLGIGKKSKKSSKKTSEDVKEHREKDKETERDKELKEREKEIRQQERIYMATNRDV